MRRTTTEAFIRIGLLAAVLASLCACEEVTPAQRALEIVSSSDRDSCTVNFAEVGAGNHPVTVIAGDAPATVSILDVDDSVLFRTKTRPYTEAIPAEGEGDQGMAMPASDEQSVELNRGEYVIECRAAGSTSTVPLHVTE